MTVFHEIDQTSFDYRKYAVLKCRDVYGRCAPSITLRDPISEFIAADEITGVRKCWCRASVLSSRVPSDVIDMEMCAEDNIDIRGMDASFRQALQKARAAPLIPSGDFRTVFLFTDARVDDKYPPIRPDNERLDREFDDVAAKIHEVGLKQVAVPHQLACVNPWQELTQRQFEIVIVNDDIDTDLSDGEVRHRKMNVPLSDLAGLSITFGQIGRAVVAAGPSLRPEHPVSAEPHGAEDRACGAANE